MFLRLKVWVVLNFRGMGGGGVQGVRDSGLGCRI